MEVVNALRSDPIRSDLIGLRLAASIQASKRRRLSIAPKTAE